MTITEIEKFRNNPLLHNLFDISCRSDEMKLTTFGLIIDTLLDKIKELEKEKQDGTTVNQI